jgi:hypothetical protein
LLQQVEQVPLDMEPAVAAAVVSELLHLKLSQ